MEGFVRFIGTGGARVVVASQLRSTGGIWLNYKSTNVYIRIRSGRSGQGPGGSRPSVDPAKLDGIILTHKHIDHANDVNVMVEAMTESGRKHRGVLFCPGDAIGEDPVVLRYVREYLEGIEVLKEKATYKVREVTFSVPVRHKHGVEAYGSFFTLTRG